MKFFMNVKTILLLILLITTQAHAEVYVFVSSSMTKPNLIKIVKEAKERHANVVMRGLIQNSFEQTVKFLHEVIEKAGQGVIIDPTLFEEYSITFVPSFVVVRGADYDKISGNITLAFALEKMNQ